MVALVDDEDYYWLSEWNWFPVKIKGVWYAKRNLKKLHSGHKIQVYLHRVVMRESDPKVFIDHQNHNGLDCQKTNLRKCSKSQNDWNKAPKEGGSSQYKGVSWDKERNLWKAQLCKDRVKIELGRFSNEIDAAKAYDVLAKEKFGEFAHLNFKN